MKKILFIAFFLFVISNVRAHSQCGFFLRMNFKGVEKSSTRLHEIK
ncbi:hypothetical protein [Mucilaginibacter sp. FT3.2]|nr:hypothetical protein [Mucilaginibacter sp. FT3.2]MBB6231703.1 hypothetical protein [Mucilaginibacter sp. FT3.2]